MPGLSPDTSMYNNLIQNQQQPSPIDTIAKYAGIQNSLIQNQLMQGELPILQQRQTQEAIKTRQDQAGIDTANILADPKYTLADGVSKDWNPMLADAAVNHPISVPGLMAARQAALAQVNLVPGPNGEQRTDTQEHVTAHGLSKPNQSMQTSISANSIGQQPTSAGSSTGYAGPGYGQESAAVLSANNENAAQKDLPASVNRVTLLRQAKEAVSNAPKTGPKSDAFNALKSTMLTLAPDLATKVLQIDPNDVNAYDMAAKDLVQYAAQQPGASRSDQGEATQIVSNPNLHMQPGAINNIINSLIGRERMQQGMMQDWASVKKQGAPSSKFNDFTTDYAKNNYDYRGFAMDENTPEQNHNLAIDAQNNGEGDRLNKSIAKARTYGYSLPPKKGQ